MKPLPDTSTKSSTLKISLICFTILLCVGAIFAKPLYIQVKAIRAGYFLKQAKIFLKENNIQNALEKAMLAQKLDPKNENTIRFLAQVFSNHNRIEGLFYWKELLQSPKKTHQDSLQFIHYALNLNYPEAASECIFYLLSLNTLSPEDYTAIIRYWQSIGSIDLARDYATKANQDFPENALFKLSLSQLLLYPNRIQDKEKAFDLLYSLMGDTNNTNRINAYILLIQNFELDASIKAKIVADPILDTTQDPHLKASFKIALYPEQKKEIIAEEISKSHENKNIKQLVQFLNSQAAYQQTLALLQPDNALHSKDLIIPYLDALAGTKNWQKIQEIIFSDNLVLDAFLAQIFKTRVAIETGDDLLTQSEWNLAFSMAKRDNQKLMLLAEYFEKLKVMEFAYEAYSQLLEDPNFSLISAKHMLAMAQEEGNTQKSLAIYQELLKHFPESLEFAVSKIYLELLLKNNLEENLANAQKLLKENPQKHYIRHLCALAYLQKGDPQNALASYGDNALDSNYTPPGWMAIYISTLAANQKTEIAKLLYKKIDTKSLKKEEQAIVNTYLRLQ